MSELRTNKIYPRDGLPAGASGGIIQLKFNSSGTGSGGAITINSTSFTDIVEVSITPTSASNKIYMIFNLNANNEDSSSSLDRLKIRVLRNGSSIWHADEALVSYDNGNIHVQGLGGSYLDSPASTSSVTYKLQVASSHGNTLNVNNNGRSDFTLMEVSG